MEKNLIMKVMAEETTVVKKSNVGANMKIEGAKMKKIVKKRGRGKGG